MSLEHDNMSGEVVEYTSRRCSRCGCFYVWPKGSRRPNAECPSCSPSLDDALSGALPQPQQAPAEPLYEDEPPAPMFPCRGCGEPTTAGLYCVVCVPGGQPGLCVYCRTTDAEAWLDGEPCCVGCAEAVIERQAALALNPWLQLPAFDGTAFLEGKT